MNAGVLPKLENKRQFFIATVRFGNWTLDNLKHPLDIVEETIATVEKKIAEAPHQESFLRYIESEDISLWQHIKNLELTSPNQTLLLVFDQFEELFTYPKGVTEFAEALADLLYSRMPKNFQRALRLATRNNANLLTPEQSEFLERPVKLKVVISIRSDRVGLLASLSSHIPGILLNCYELKPLSRKQAEYAVIKPAEKPGEFQSLPFTYQEKALTKILDYLTQNGDKPIESFQLQILCQFIEKDIVISRNETYVEEHDLGDLESIYQNYYDNSLKKLGTEDTQRKARIFIEEGLIFAEEKRRTTLLKGQIHNKFNITPELLQHIVHTHLIQPVLHYSGGYDVYELSHDTLVAPILKAKSLRLELERKAKRKKQKQRAIWTFAVPIGIYLIFIIFAVILSVGLSKAGLDIPKWIELMLMWLIIIGSAPLCFVIMAPFLIGPFAFAYEIIVGESVLAKLRTRANNPAKQKGILTKLGKWLS